MLSILGFGSKVQPTATTLRQSASRSIASEGKVAESRETEVVHVPDCEAAPETAHDNPGKYKPKLFDVWAMGMATVLTGIYYGWNAGFAAGFGSYLIAQILQGLAYIVLVCALAEIVSSTSFSGGAYGMARVMLGFYPGFLMAMFELTEYITYAGAAYQYVAVFTCEKMEWNETYQPLVALVLCVALSLLLLESDRIFWAVSGLFGVYCVVGILFFCFGSLPYTNFIQNASLHIEPRSSSPKNWFSGGMTLFLQILPLTTWAFGGIEAGALVTDMIHDPRRNLSWGLVIGVLSLFGLIVFAMFVTAALPPGLFSVNMDDDAGSLVNNEIFMKFGFARMGFYGDVADWIMIPSQVSMALGFMLPSAKLFHAMSCSHLIPPVFGGQNIQICYMYTAPLSLLSCLFAMYIPGFDITNLPILFASITFLSDLYAYHQMQNDFSTMERVFKSPFGTGAVAFAALVFLLTIVSLLAFQESFFMLYFAICYVAFLTLYYFLFAKSRQIFSNEEQKTLLTMHVLSMNKKRRTAKRARSQAFSRSKLSASNGVTQKKSSIAPEND
jgi:amino acid transporter